MTARRGTREQRRRHVREVDIEIGRMLKAKREEHGWTQQAVAAELGVSWQQVQKYERGTNRVSAGTMLVWLKTLDASSECEVLLGDGYQHQL